MSHLEGIEKLKEEAHALLDGNTGGCTCFGPDDTCSFHTIRNTQESLIDRAFSLGGKSVVAQLLEALPDRGQEAQFTGRNPDIQKGAEGGYHYAKELLIAKAIQLGVMEGGLAKEKND